MDYSEYHEKELAIRQKMNELQEKYQAEMMVAKQELSDLTNEYLGEFAVGKAVKLIIPNHKHYGKIIPHHKHYGKKFYVEEVNWISDIYTTVNIRKAKKDGSPSANGFVCYGVQTNTDLEVWDDLER